MSKLDAFISELETWLGTPWIQGQCVNGQATDCLQFILASAKTVGIDLGDYKGYQVASPTFELIDICNKNPNLIPTKELKPGVIVVQKVRNYPRHLGVFIGDNTIIHATYEQGVIKDKNLNVWLRLCAGKYLINGLG